MTNSATDVNDWPSLAIGLYDALTGRRAEITYDFDDFQVSVPSKSGDGASHADWKMSGTLRIRTRERS
jgi:hypothetical protein